MVLSRLRPSVLVGAWTLVVVGVFVARGDLRIASAAERGATVASAAAERAPGPIVVKARSAPRPAATVRQRGRVFDARGFLVVGAEVVPMTGPSLRTDGDGAFGIELEPGGTIDLLVRADGMRPAWRRASDGSPEPLCVRLEPAAPWDPPAKVLEPPSTLRGEGIVRDALARPLAGAFVTADATGVWSRTDDIGRFALPLPTPATTLIVHHPDGGENGMGCYGVAANIVALRSTGATPVPDVVLGPASGVRGIVCDARGQPVAGVPVEITGEGLQRLVETGPGGAFRAGGLPPGSYRVQPGAWRGAIAAPASVELGAEPVDLDLRLVAADEVRLRVVDERATPVAGVIVAAIIGGARRGIARADANGYAAVPVAFETEFDVRTPEHHAAVVVRRFDPDPATLVVAMP
jgi:hypothetical protein